VIVRTDGVSKLNGDTSLLEVNIMATNGVIHIIDEVLIPPSLRDTVMPANDLLRSSSSFSSSPPPMTILELAVASSDFGLLTTAVQAANLSPRLKGNGPLTLFAPTDAAFMKLGEAKISELLMDHTMLTEILLYHVVSGTVLSGDLEDVDSLSTLQGESIMVEAIGEFSMMDDEFLLNGAVNFVDMDMLASNGVAHSIDTVLIPPSLQS